MPLYRYSSAKIEPLVRTSFAAEQIREREDIQRLLINRIDIIGEDLLVIAEEYGLFQDSRRRIDILALDRGGNLVVIELKRTEDGGHVELQALRYAAMVSTITLDHLVETLADARSVSVVAAREIVLDWIEEPIEELPNHVRIVLISADFSTEVTSTVLWLNENYALDISCVRIVPYRLETEILLDLQQIIPLPEAKDFQIHQRHKGAAATAGRSGTRDFTYYSITIGDEQFSDLSKQAAIKKVLQKLHGAGVDVDRLKSATNAGRWIGVHPSPGELVRDAFIREHPDRSPTNLWFDLDIASQGNEWVVPRFGGLRTESILSNLATAAAPTTLLTWSRAEATEVVTAP